MPTSSTSSRCSVNRLWPRVASRRVASNGCRAKEEDVEDKQHQGQQQHSNQDQLGRGWASVFAGDYEAWLDAPLDRPGSTRVWSRKEQEQIHRHAGGQERNPNFFEWFMGKRKS